MSTLFWLLLILAHSSPVFLFKKPQFHFSNWFFRPPSSAILEPPSRSWSFENEFKQLQEPTTTARKLNPNNANVYQDSYSRLFDSSKVAPITSSSSKVPENSGKASVPDHHADEVRSNVYISTSGDKEKNDKVKIWTENETKKTILTTGNQYVDSTAGGSTKAPARTLRDLLSTTKDVESFVEKNSKYEVDPDFSEKDDDDESFERFASPLFRKEFGNLFNTNVDFF